jgi:hypothetical protein
MEELVEYDARKVAKHYLMTWFLPDLISALPMDLLLHVKVYQKQTTIKSVIVTVHPALSRCLFFFFFSLLLFVFFFFSISWNHI